MRISPYKCCTLLTFNPIDSALLSVAAKTSDQWPRRDQAWQDKIDIFLLSYTFYTLQNIKSRWHSRLFSMLVYCSNASWWAFRYSAVSMNCSTDKEILEVPLLTAVDFDLRLVHYWLLETAFEYPSDFFSCVDVVVLVVTRCHHPHDRAACLEWNHTLHWSSPD